jgi:hypothetical protein
VLSAPRASGRSPAMVAIVVPYLVSRVLRLTS